MGEFIEIKEREKMRKLVEITKITTLDDVETIHKYIDIDGIQFDTQTHQFTITRENGDLF